MLSSFLRDEKGAITVDYVVLTAACGFLGVAVVGTISGGTEERANHFTDTQVEIWRKGENSLANYNPYDAEGFAALYGAVQGMDPSDLQFLSDFSMLAHSSGVIETLPDADQAYWSELENSIKVHYAEERGVRMNPDLTEWMALASDPAALQSTLVTMMETYEMMSAGTEYGLGDVEASLDNATQSLNGG